MSLIICSVVVVLSTWVEATGVSCHTDADCPYGKSQFRCCPITGRAENCGPPATGVKGYDCVLPGTLGNSTCACTASAGCGDSSKYKKAVPELKQWLMIGDSISEGTVGYIRENVNLTALGIQVTHNPTNAANVWYGLHCLSDWLGPDPKRWDVITFNFGLHDLARDNERLEPSFYGSTLTNFTTNLKAAVPSSTKILWVTTTPVPQGISGACNKTNAHGGCPPRFTSDPPIYNKMATGALKDFPTVGVIDLYSVVTKKCGTNYTLCPENCDSWPSHPGRIPCFSRPYNVHYFDPGWKELAAAYINAVQAAAA